MHEIRRKWATAGVLVMTLGGLCTASGGNHYDFSQWPSKHKRTVSEHRYKAPTLYSVTGSSTGTSLHAMLASAQVFYPRSSAVICNMAEELRWLKTELNVLIGACNTSRLNDTQNCQDAPSRNVETMATLHPFFKSCISQFHNHAQ